MPNVKTAISVPEKLFKQVDRYAKRRKLSRSEVFSNAAQLLLSRATADEITKQLDEHYTKYPLTKEDYQWLDASARDIGELLKGDKW
jgi:hypothetical protein